MKRSGFQRPNYQEYLERVQAANARPRTPLKRGRIKPLGKKGKQWAEVRRQLKNLFYDHGITSCEFPFILHNCWRQDGLSFAHCRKRRELLDGEIWHVALACPNAHTHLDEKLTHEQMHYAVHRAIEARGGVIKP